MVVPIALMAPALLLVGPGVQAEQPQLTIIRAVADQPPDSASGTILIEGRNLAIDQATDLVVSLAGEALSIIGTPTATEIVAELRRASRDRSGRQARRETRAIRQRCRTARSAICWSRGESRCGDAGCSATRRTRS
jgi:hypothetical protein